MDASIYDGDDSTVAVEVEVIEDPEVISRCCAAALSKHKLLVCCACEDSDAGVAAIVIFPIGLKYGHPFCGSCFQSFSIWNLA